MIGVEEAKRIVIEAATRTATEDLDLHACTGFRLAKEVRSPHDHPLFDMSAVDGYALGSNTDSKAWKLVGEVAAGEVHSGTLNEGECIRIFTGAMVPQGATTVVMQEFVTRTADSITHNDVKLKVGGNIRLRGEQLKAGDLLMNAGSLLDAAAVGLLASAGVCKVAVHQKPIVNIVRTGGEFIAGDRPGPGRIFSSNEVMLASALHAAGIPSANAPFTPSDEVEALRAALVAACRASDVVISTGGVSVGEYDLVRSTLEGMGAEILFHGVHQKPGKPMLFARLGGTAIFALPGNPRAVLMAWWEYVLPFLRAVQGDLDPLPRNDRLPSTTSFSLKGDRAEFRAAHVSNGTVTVLKDEGSHMLRSLLEANAIAFLPGTLREVTITDPIDVHHLPQQ